MREHSIGHASPGHEQRSSEEREDTDEDHDAAGS